MLEDGIENFTFELLEECPREELNKKDLKLWVKGQNPSYWLSKQMNSKQRRRHLERFKRIIDKHAKYYKFLMRALVEVNSGEEKPLTGITIWGHSDMGNIDETSYSYKMNGPYCGLFTPGCDVKDAFYEVYVMLKEKAAE